MVLAPTTEREVATPDLIRRWRELAGSIPDAVELRFEAASFGAGEAIKIQLEGRDIEELRAAAAELRADLGTYEGVLDISDSFRAGKREIKLSILPEAELLGLTQTDLARQVREAFYGTPLQRLHIPRRDARHTAIQDRRTRLGRGHHPAENLSWLW